MKSTVPRNFETLQYHNITIQKGPAKMPASPIPYRPT